MNYLFIFVGDSQSMAENSPHRTIEEIRAKIAQGTAVIMTAHELCQLTQKGKEVKFEDVDVITTATKGLMSGTSAVMAFRIGEPGEFIKAKRLWMNNIPCYVGPCPNETLGLVDLIIYATDHSESDPNYGAGHLLRELVEGKSVHVEADTIEGKHIIKDIQLKDIYFAQMMGIRHAFKNYSAFINPSKDYVKSIFAVMDMAPNNTEISFCGCGSINPIENDPAMDVIGMGTPILINGAIGAVIGTGTRASVGRPNLMTIAPLNEMKPEFMGGFVTSRGPEVICTMGIAIPILNQRIFNNLKKTDKYVPLTIVDVVGRKTIGKTDYGRVWKRNLIIAFKQGLCDLCELRSHCPVVHYCPTACFTPGLGMDRSKCFNCGTCIRACPKGACIGDLGSIEFEGKEIPVVLRQSDRNGAIQLMDLLKKKILSGEFPITLPTAKLKIYEEKR
jgi:putative methanogenesis marker 16 metalloprotein